MDDLVSIVVPAYNVEEYIGECLKSIQQQTFDNWQAIIVDDGSSDKTVEVIQTVIGEDRRFRLIRQPNGGVSRARNTGIQAATGTYLAFLDSDDMWEPAFLAELLQALQSGGADMAYCGYTHLYSGGLRRKFSYPYVSGHIMLAVIQGKTQIHIGALLVKRALVEETGLSFTEDCLVGQDQEFIWKLVANATVQAVPQELMIYRIRGGSALTAKWQWEKHIHAYYGFKRAAEHVLLKPPPAYDRDLLSRELNERIGYKLYRFIWRMIKNGYREEARRLLNTDECKGYLAQLVPGRMKIVDRFKYRVVNAKEGIWWNLTRFL